VARVFRKVVRTVTTVTWSVSWLEEDGGPAPQPSAPIHCLPPPAGEEQPPEGAGPEGGEGTAPEAP
jgi:hypothetical protein